MCYNHWESTGVQPYLVTPSKLEEEYMVESHSLLTDLKATIVDTSSEIHHVGSIEMWRNPNDDDDDDLDPDDDWYSSDTQDSFLDFD